MSKIAVLGNGESRKFLNIESLKADYTIIGCNAVHRDYPVDHLICCDRRMVKEATENPNIKETFIYVREEHYHYFRKVKKNKKIHLLPTLPYVGDRRADIPTHWGSGPYAILIACLMSPQEIHIFGFDLYGNGDFVNNIYKGSVNYKSTNESAVDPSYWIYQISKLMILYPKIHFFVYNNEDWNIPIQWKQNNVSFKIVSCENNKYPLY